MGCATDTDVAEVGICGMHAYSLLQLIEIPNVPVSWVYETGVAHGNVSGFGVGHDAATITLRLLQIRNPHGQGEWKGAFSDKSDVWQRLLQQSRNTSIQLPKRTKVNDGTFWIDFDNFLMAFSRIDVVLAFRGNHAVSYTHLTLPTKA